MPPQRVYLCNIGITQAQQIKDDLEHNSHKIQHRFFFKSITAIQIFRITEIRIKSQCDGPTSEAEADYDLS